MNYKVSPSIRHCYCTFQSNKKEGEMKRERTVQKLTICVSCLNVDDNLAVMDGLDNHMYIYSDIKVLKRRLAIIET